MAKTPHKIFLTAKEVAVVLDIDYRKVIRQAKAGKIIGTKLGRTWRFDQDAFLPLHTAGRESGSPSQASSKIPAFEITAFDYGLEVHRMKELVKSYRGPMPEVAFDSLSKELKYVILAETPILLPEHIAGCPQRRRAIELAVAPQEVQALIHRELSAARERGRGGRQLPAARFTDMSEVDRDTLRKYCPELLPREGG